MVKTILLPIQKQLTKMGLMWAAAGVEVFYRVLHGEVAQVLVFSGQVSRLSALLSGVREQRVLPVATQVPGLAEGELLEKTQRYLRQLLSRQIDLSVEKIEPQLELEKYGIDSVMVMAMTGELEQSFGTLSKTLFFEHRTIRELSEYFIDQHRSQLLALLQSQQAAAEPTSSKSPDSGGRRAAQSRNIARLRLPQDAPPAADRTPLREQFPELVLLNSRQASGRPIFWLHAALGGVDSYARVAREIDRPFYGIRARGLEAPSTPRVGIAALASYYVESLIATRPLQPIDLGGYSMGGCLAYEMARQLQQLGWQVASLVMIDTFHPSQIASADASTAGKCAILRNANAFLDALHGAASASRHGAHYEHLTHRDEHAALTGQKGKPEAYLSVVVSQMLRKGVRRNADQLTTMLRRAMTVQGLFEYADYVPKPLPSPQTLACIYFLNRSNELFGGMAPYFDPTAAARKPRKDHWTRWRKMLPTLKKVDVPASNHFVLLAQPEALSTITDVCRSLYAASDARGTMSIEAVA